VPSAAARPHATTCVQIAEPLHSSSNGTIDVRPFADVARDPNPRRRQRCKFGQLSLRLRWQSDLQ
jgi:hypothetical protein